MSFVMMGRKLGMTRVYTDKGVSLPVTVIQVGPCVVTQVRTADKDGYSAVQVGFDDVHPRNSTMPVIGHDFKAGTGPKRFHRECRLGEGKTSELTVGQSLGAEVFEKIAYVDVAGVSKGKGFAGVMKRHHFKGLFASHGTERKHRSPGSIGSLCSNRGYGGGLAKGKKMPGHMGAERVSMRSLDVVRVDKDKNLLMVKGAVPGANNAMVEIRPSVRLYKTKAKKQKEMAA